jgi:hypothetical protein
MLEVSYGSEGTETNHLGFLFDDSLFSEATTLFKHIQRSVWHFPSHIIENGYVLRHTDRIWGDPPKIPDRRSPLRYYNALGSQKLEHISALFTDFQFRDNIPGHENITEHASIRGRVSLGYTPRRIEFNASTALPTICRLLPTTQGYVVATADEAVPTSTVWYGSFKETIDHINGRIGLDTALSANILPLHYHWLRFNYILTSTGLYFKTLRYYQRFDTNMWSCDHIQGYIAPTIQLKSPDDGLTTSFADDASCKFGVYCDRRSPEVGFGSSSTYDYFSGSSEAQVYDATPINVGSNGPIDYGYHWAYEQPSYTTYLYSAPRSAFVPDVIGLKDGHYSSATSNGYRKFKSVVNSLGRDSMALSAIAAQDALDTGIASFGTNLIEPAAELGDLFGLMGVAEVTEMLPRLRNIKGLSLLDKLLKVLSSATLVYSFGIAPTLGDANKIAEGASAFRHRWLSGGNFADVELRGKEAIVVPHEFCGGFENLRLTARVKLVVSIPPDLLLQYALPLRALGLYPDLSTLWAVIPFSFLVDSLFDFGETLSRVDSTRHLLALDVKYSVLSHLYEWEFPDDVKDQYGVVDESNAISGNAQAHYRHYVRQPINGFPQHLPSALTESLLYEKPLPSWEVSSSLIYQIVG